MANGFYTEKNGVRVGVNVPVPGAEGPRKEATVELVIAWPEPPPGTIARNDLINLLQSALVGLLPTAYKEIDERITNA